jgi:hypothetical protein
MSEPITKASDDYVIRFSAQIFKFQTLIDGGWRLTLDGSGDPETVVKILQAKQPGIFLEVVALPVLQSITNGETETKRRTKGSPIDLAGG